MADTPKVPAEVYEAAARAYARAYVHGFAVPLVDMAHFRAAVESAYTAGHDAHLTEWAHNLTAGIDDEETLKARRLALARRLVAPEIRDATRDQHVGERLAAWLRAHERAAEGGPDGS